MPHAYFAATNAFCSQSGTKGFGCLRPQVTKTKDEKPLAREQIRASDGIIPMQAGGGEYRLGGQTAGTTPIGSLRAQVPRVKYSAQMTDCADDQSQTFIHRLAAPNPANKAGSGVIDCRRGQTWAAGLQKTSPSKQYAMDYGDKLCLFISTTGLPNDALAHVGLLWDTNMAESVAGTGAGVSGLGAFRQINPEIISGQRAFTMSELVQSRQQLPWQTNAQAQSDLAGTGGFAKRREVPYMFRPRLY